MRLLAARMTTVPYTLGIRHGAQRGFTKTRLGSAGAWLLWNLMPYGAPSRP